MSTKDPNKIYVVVSNDGSTVIGIAISGVLTTIPVPASGEVITLTQVQYDALNPKVATTLYFIELNGVIVKAYLGDKELTLDSNTSAIVKSEITEMFSNGVEWETINGEKRLKSISYSKINVDNPGEFYEQTGFEDLVKNTVKTAGFISKTDNTQSFSEMYATEVGKDSTIAKKASIIAAINESGESNVTINAEKLNLEGYVKANELDVVGNISGKTITGVTLNGGSINIGNGNFAVTGNGDITAKSGTFSNCTIDNTCMIQGIPITNAIIVSASENDSQNNIYLDDTLPSGSIVNVVVLGAYVAHPIKIYSNKTTRAYYDGSWTYMNDSTSSYVSRTDIQRPGIFTFVV